LFNSHASSDFQPDYAIAVFIREPDRQYTVLADLGAGILMDATAFI
jgi:hypothetical protein